MELTDLGALTAPMTIRRSDLPTEYRAQPFSVAQSIRRCRYLQHRWQR